MAELLQIIKTHWFGYGHQLKGQDFYKNALAIDYFSENFYRMIRLLLGCLLCTAVLLCEAQKRDSDDTLHFKLSCGFAGITSQNVDQYRQMLKKSEYALIRSNLFNGSLSSAALSVIALKELKLNRRLQLMPDEENRIEEISKLTNRYLVCFTCTQRYEGTVGVLLSERTNPAYLLIRRYLFDK